MRFLIASLLFIAHLAGSSTAADKRLPPPDAAAIETAKRSIAEVFAADIEKAKTSVARKDLAARSLKAANDAKETEANRWVLYHQACDLAAIAGDVELTQETIIDLTRVFQIKRVVAADAVEKLARTMLMQGPKALFDFASSEAELAIEADDYPSALRLLGIAVRFSVATKDPQIKRRTEVRQLQVRDLAKAFDDVKGIDEHMGRFQCFRKGNWKVGLPLLVNAPDEGLAAVARKDLTKPSDPKEQVEIGNAWYELSEKAKGEERLAMMRRAFYWMIGGLGSTSGLVKAKVESRLTKIISEVEDADARDGRFTLLAGRWRISWNNNVKWEMTITPLGRVDKNRDIQPDGAIKDPNIEGYEYLTRRHGNVTAKKGEGIALYKNGEVIDVYRISAEGIAIDRYNPGAQFPKKINLAGKVMPLR